MATCDMCGVESRLVNAKVEGTLLAVCENCARFGDIVCKSAPKTNIYSADSSARNVRPLLAQRKEVLQIISENYPQKIRTARERLGLTQEEFSKMLNEKVSIMQKIETGQFEPSIDMARKLENKLKIDLIEKYSESGDTPLVTGSSSEGSGLTLGDFIKTRKK